MTMVYMNQQTSAWGGTCLEEGRWGWTVAHFQRHPSGKPLVMTVTVRELEHGP